MVLAILFFYNVDSFVTTLHIVPLACKLLEKLVALQLLKHCAVGCNLLQITALLSLKAVYVALRLCYRDYRLAYDKECQNRDNDSKSAPKKE